jgi:hypothetical protein
VKKNCIPFIAKTRKVDNPEETADKAKFIKLEFLMGPSNPASKYARHFIIFKDGCAEDWIKWLIAYRIVVLMTFSFDFEMFFFNCPTT